MHVLLNGLKFKAVSSALPATEVKTSDFYANFGQKEVDRIVANTGIHSLRIADDTLNASDLCFAAVNQLFERAGIERKSIDAIIFISQTPDLRMPPTSCLLQHKLQLNKGIVAFDINYGCSGYIYGLYQAALLVSSKSAQRVLVCAGDVISRFINPSDHKLRLVLGDAGSATIVEIGTDQWAFDINTDGSGSESLMIPRNNNHDGYLNMDGSAVMEFALREVSTSFESVILQQKWSNNDILNAVLHQPNEFMLNYLRKKIGLTKQQMPIAVKNYGNTGPASIPLTLCDAYSDSGEIGKAVFAGFGVGLSWGAIALNIKDTIICKPFSI